MRLFPSLELTLDFTSFIQACIAGAWGGLIAGVVAWLATTSALNNGSITIDTTFGDYEMLAGNLAAIGVGAIISVGGSYMYVKYFSDILYD